MLKGTYKFLLDIGNSIGVKPIPDYDPTKAPPPPPHHYITFGENNGIPYGIYESEHGKQMIAHYCYSTDVIRFTALAGTPGDELFFYDVRVADGKISGYAYREGMHQTPLSGELIAG